MLAFMLLVHYVSEKYKFCESSRNLMLRACAESVQGKKELDSMSLFAGCTDLK